MFGDVNDNNGSSDSTVMIVTIRVEEVERAIFSVVCFLLISSTVLKTRTTYFIKSRRV